MRKIFLVFSFFAVTQTLLFTSIFLLLTFPHNPNKNSLPISSNHSVTYAALPSSENLQLKDQIIQEDARIEIVRQFFKRHNSPLEPFAATIVETADVYDVDFRLIPAIAMQESNLCKKAPPDSHNCWGFGIYGSKITLFDNFEKAIHSVTKTLAQKYIALGLDTPYKIMKKYTPRSNGSWAEGVEYFINQLQ